MCGDVRPQPRRRQQQRHPTDSAPRRDQHPRHVAKHRAIRGNGAQWERGWRVKGDWGRVSRSAGWGLPFPRQLGSTTKTAGSAAYARRSNEPSCAPPPTSAVSSRVATNRLARVTTSRRSGAPRCIDARAPRTAWRQPWPQTFSAVGSGAGIRLTPFRHPPSPAWWRKTNGRADGHGGIRSRDGRKRLRGVETCATGSQV